MTSNHQSENHNPNGPHDLGQITKDDEMKCDQCGSIHSVGMVIDGKNLCPECWNPLPWVIVEQAGTDDESIYSDHATYRAAIQHAIEFLGAEFYEDGFDIMRRRDDGVLTTEF